VVFPELRDVGSTHVSVILITCGCCYVVDLLQLPFVCYVTLPYCCSRCCVTFTLLFVRLITFTGYRCVVVTFVTYGSGYVWCCSLRSHVVGLFVRLRWLHVYVRCCVRLNCVTALLYVVVVGYYICCDTFVNCVCYSRERERERERRSPCAASGDLVHLLIPGERLYLCHYSSAASNATLGVRAP